MNRGAGLLRTAALGGGYGGVTVVRGVNLEVAAGTALCVTGRNGVGKTTLARLITGSLRPTAGSVLFEGADITAMPAHRRSRLGMGYAPQEAVVFDTLSVTDNLTLHLRDPSLARYAGLFDAFPWIPQRGTQRAGTLSGGEKKILSFCRALAEDTRLVVLDEPTEGVQPENIARMAAAIREEKPRGRAFLIVEQNLTFVEAVADAALVLDHGETVHHTEDSATMRASLSRRMQI